MAIDDTRLRIKWWKRRCRYGSCETGSNWHKPATGRADNDAPSKRERQPRRQINSERCTIHAPLRSRFGSTFTHQFFPLKSFNFSRFGNFKFSICSSISSIFYICCNYFGTEHVVGGESEIINENGNQ